MAQEVIDKVNKNNLVLKSNDDDNGSGKYAAVLPIVGLKYYLVHYETGKYIRSKDGLIDIKNDGTLLEYYSGKPDLSCVFEFTMESPSNVKHASKGAHGSTFQRLKHYGSGYYLGIDYNSDNYVLNNIKNWSNHSFGNYYRYNDHTNEMRMILKDNRTYLQGLNNDRTGISINTNKDGKRVTKWTGDTAFHYICNASGDSDNPSDGTHLTYTTNNGHPSYSIVLLPAEDDVIVSSINFDQSKLSSLPIDNITAQTTVANNTNTDQEMEATVEYDRSTTNTFELKFEEKASFSIESSTEASAELFGMGAKETISFKFGFEFGATQSKSTTTTQGVKNSITVKPLVKAGTMLKVVVTTQRKSGNVPFVMHLKSQSGVEFERKGTLKTEYFFDQIITYDQYMMNKL